MDKELIDRGTYYEIKDYKPIVKFDENGNIVSIINCPYIPKFLVDGGGTSTKRKFLVRVLRYLRNLFNYDYQRQKQITAYLSKSVDLVDLERRQKKLARKRIY